MTPRTARLIDYDPARPATHAGRAKYRIIYMGKPTGYRWCWVPGLNRYSHFDAANEAAGRLAASHRGVYVYAVIRGNYHAEYARYGSCQPETMQESDTRMRRAGAFGAAAKGVAS